MALRVVRPGFDPERFFARLRRASRRILLLDYDGTLSPLRPERDQALPYPGVRETLEMLLAAGHSRVAIVTGRAVHDLLPLLGLDRPPEIWGCHGWEHLDAHGRYHPPRLDDGFRRILDQARLQLNGLPEAGERCEIKPASLAFHVRGLAPHVAESLLRQVEERWAPLARHPGLQIRPFDGGVELRVSGRDKGSVVEDVVGAADPRTAAAYLGDDLTDEDAFRAIRGRGMGVLVRPRLRPTAADVWIRPPRELLEFLARWHREATSAA